MGFAQRGYLGSREQRNVTDIGQILCDKPVIIFVRGPAQLVETRKVDGRRIAAQGLVAAFVEILVEIREHQLAHGPINRFAIAQDRVIGFRNRTPTTMALEQSDYVIEVARRACEIEQQRRLAAQTQSQGSQHGALDAMRASFPDHAARRQARVTLGFAVVWNPIQVILNLAWRIQTAQQAQLVFGEAVHGL